MARESRQCLLNGLLISNVTVDFRKKSKPASVPCRHRYAGLCHEGTEADRFDSYRLTARVRAGDDDSVRLPVHDYVILYGNIRRDERMECCGKIDAAVCHDLGFRAAHYRTILRLCEYHINMMEPIIGHGKF